MDDKLVLLTPRQFGQLLDYSSSMPSGVYPGKCWRRAQLVRVGTEWRRSGKWLLGWYGAHEDPKLCSNNWRLIEVVT